MDNTTPTTITIGRTFFDDHVSRDLPVPTVVRETKTRVTLAVEPGTRGWDDLLSDAWYYSGFADDPDTFYRSLGQAAERVRLKMRAAEKATGFTHSPLGVHGTAGPTAAMGF